MTALGNHSRSSLSKIQLSITALGRVSSLCLVMQKQRRHISITGELANSVSRNVKTLRLMQNYGGSPMKISTSHPFSSIPNIRHLFPGSISRKREANGQRRPSLIQALIHLACVSLFSRPFPGSVSLTPAFRKWLSYGIAVSFLSATGSALAIGGHLAVRDSGSDVWRVQSSLLRRIGEDAQVAAVLLDKGEQCVSTILSLKVNGKSISCEGSKEIVWSWYVMEPIARDYDNGSSCLPPKPGCVQSISYRQKEIVELRGKAKISAIELDKFLGLGTHWLFVADQKAAPTMNVVEVKGRPTAFELVVRRDESYAGYLTELLGVPFTYLPSLTPDGKHQTESRLGADCVAVLVYGQRRLGNKVPYMAPPALIRYTSVVPRLTPEGQPVKSGDILYFGFQTAVVSVDRNRIGLLDEEDLIIHTYHRNAEEVTFASLPYKHTSFQVRRWNTALEPTDR